MNKTNTSMFVSGLFMCLLALTFFSCALGSTKIGDIIGHPRDYADKEVTVSGEVVETFSLFVLKYFTVRDDSGEIAVVTERALPAMGEKIKVKGTVKEAFSIGSKTALVLVENTEKK